MLGSVHGPRLVRRTSHSIATLHSAKRCQSSHPSTEHANLERANSNLVSKCSAAFLQAGTPPEPFEAAPACSSRGMSTYSKEHSLRVSVATLGTREDTVPALGSLPRCLLLHDDAQNIWILCTDLAFLHCAIGKLAAVLGSVRLLSLRIVLPLPECVHTCLYGCVCVHHHK